jgi:hypothetical protein
VLLIPRKLVVQFLTHVIEVIFFCNSLPARILAGCKLLFLDSFAYLDHIIDNTVYDDNDIQREFKSLFIRAE